MVKWLTEAEALAEIQASDFYLLRLPETRGPLAESGGLQTMLRAFGTLPAANRQSIIRKRFAMKLLNTFKDVRSEAVRDNTFEASVLGAWLDALIDHEVATEIGPIPDV